MRNSLSHIHEVTLEFSSSSKLHEALASLKDGQIVSLIDSSTSSNPLRWHLWTDDYSDYVACPVCGYGEEGEVKLADATPFCPMCGEHLIDPTAGGEII